MHPLRQTTWLIATLALLWLVLALPARWVGGAAGLEGLTWAIGLCLFPGLLVLLVPKMAAAPHAILLSTAVRMLLVLAGVLVIRETRPELGFREFFAWLILSYMAALAIESFFLVRQQQQAAADPSSGQS